MQEVIFKINTVKEVAKIYIKKTFKNGNFDVIKQMVKNGYKTCKKLCSKLLFKTITNQQQWHLKYKLRTNLMKM